MPYGIGLAVQGMNRGFDQWRERNRNQAIQDQQLEMQRQQFDMQQRAADQQYGIRANTAEQQQVLFDQGQADRERETQQQESLQRFRAASARAQAGDTGALGEIFGDVFGEGRLERIEGGYKYTNDSGSHDFTDADIGELFGLSDQDWLATITAPEIAGQTMTSLRRNPERFIPATHRLALENNDASLAVPRDIGSSILMARARALNEAIASIKTASDRQRIGITEDMTPAETQRALIMHFMPIINEQFYLQWQGAIPRESLEMLLSYSMPEDEVGITDIPLADSPPAESEGSVSRSALRAALTPPWMESSPVRQAASGFLDRFRGQSEPERNPNAAPGSRNNPIPWTPELGSPEPNKFYDHPRHGRVRADIRTGEWVRE